MRNRKSIVQFFPYFLVGIIFMMILGVTQWTATTKVLDYNELITVIENEEIEEVKMTVGKNITTISGAYIEEEKKIGFSATIPSTSLQLDNVLDQLEEAKISITDAEQTNMFFEIFRTLLPILLFGGLTLFLLRGMMAQGNRGAEATSSKARLESDIKVRFDDVAGCVEEKEELQELIEYLQSPDKFAKMGARIPKGFLMVGPPGTGKTLLAKAVAGEAKVPFFSASGSDFVELYVGAGAARVRDMFKKAKKLSPCIIFIDEIDAVARQRGAGLGGGSDEKEQTLNQILVEMDGISDNKGIIIIAATNRPEMLDPALVRPGRMDRKITVGLPDRKGRHEILVVHARNKKLASDVDLAALAKRTPGFSGADLESVLNEASILAVRENSNIILKHHLDEAIDRVMMGPAKKSRKYDDKSKKLVAYHEAGHAIVGLFLGDSSTKVQKITIIPRGQAGGYNLMSEDEEKLMPTKKDFINKITTFMGGRVAEEIFFDDISAGATGDIESSTRIARDMVTLYGMSDLGPIKYDGGGQSVFLGRDYNSPTNVSGQIAFEIDKEIRKIIDGCYEKAHEVISKHKDELIKIANALLEYETITEEEIEEIVKGEKTLEEIMSPTVESSESIQETDLVEEK